MKKTSNPYLKLWLSFALCLLCAFTFSFSLSQLDSLKTQKKLLKRSFKLNEALLLNELNKKLNFLKLHIEQIKQKELIPADSPLTQLIILHQNQIEKIYSNSLEKTEKQKQLKSHKKNKALTASKKTNIQTSPKTEESLSQLKKIITDIPLEKILKDKAQISFIKIKQQDKNQLIGLRLLDNNKKELLFFKKNNSFFKIAPSNTNIYFTAVSNQNLVTFYNKMIKKSQRAQILKALTKKDTKSSKYISIKSKRSSFTNFYYLSKWSPANLYLIIQSKNSAFISKSIFSKQTKYIWISSLATVLFFLSLFIFWLRLSSLFSAYSFLKSAVISVSNKESFPLSQSKNPLLYFYNNRTALLNKTEDTKDIKSESKNQTFQDLIKKELELLKSSYPNKEVNEDYQSNVKLFGTERFLKTVIHELLLNALESMGAMKTQKIDLSLKEDKNNIVFSVRDYGTGIPEPKKAFQMYYSTKSQLGVGLNLVQSIIEANGGKIKLQPQEDKGVKAVVSFPLKIFLKQY